MTVRTGIFAGACPFTLARNWLGEAEKTEINDPNAIALSTVDAQGMPNARVVLLKAIEDDGFVFYTNYTSAKGQEVEQAQKAAFVMHWKSLRRQIRVRGKVTRHTKAASDQYYQSRGLQSRLGAWASQQSQPLASREALMQEVERVADVYGDSPHGLTIGAGIILRRMRLNFGQTALRACTIGSAGHARRTGDSGQLHD